MADEKHHPGLESAARAARSNGAGLMVWFTGLSGAGKSTLARGVCREVAARGFPTELLDADEVRKHLSRGLGFRPEDRMENVRRLGYVAGLLTRHGVVTLVAAMSPDRSVRDEIRQQTGSFVEVFVDVPVEICERRDPVGLYRRFRSGEIHNVSGLDDPYEPPLQPEVHCLTAFETVEESVAKVSRVVFASLQKSAKG